MEATVLATPSEVVAALAPTPLYWRAMSERLDKLDETVEAILMTPLFQHTYGLVHGMVMEDMIIDVRSATGLLANNIFTQHELETFMKLGLVSQLNHGLALAARKLRPRIPTVPSDSFVMIVRMTCFTYILKLVGEDLKKPHPVLQAVVAELEIDPQQRMALLQAAIANVTTQSSKIVLH